MHIPNDDTKNIPSVIVYYNKCLKRLDTELNERTNQNSIKVPNVIIKLWVLV